MATVIFMGTPAFAVPTLAQLIAQHTVQAVVTQPDRPAGRQRQAQPSPVKQYALAHGIPVLQPERIRRAEAIAELKRWTPDVYVVAAFGQILPQNVLDIPLMGSINVHASLLPRWRGAAPIQASIRAGDTETGITIMKMDAGLDTGPILSMRSIRIWPEDTSQTLHDKLAELGATLLIETLPGYLTGTLEPKPQPEAGVTFAPQIEKEEGNINWSQSAEAIERLIRAFTPWPGTYTFWNGQALRILHASISKGSAAVGMVVGHERGAAVGTGDGLLVIDEVQLAGRKALPISAFLRGHADLIGATLTDG